MLSNMVSTMSDRAGTMNCFAKLLDDHRTGLINPEIRLEFLHCNAHFLLGLSMGAEKALKRVVDEEGLKGKIGRDTLPAFNRFRSGDSAASR